MSISSPKRSSPKPDLSPHGTRRFAGRVALVTGASSGNGRATALRLAEEGASVACADLQHSPREASYDGDESTHELIQRLGGQATFVRCDVADGETVAQTYQRVLEAFGRLDVVVANAGIFPYPPLELPEEEFETLERVTAVNQYGVWWTCREGARILRQQGEGGHIVLLSSVSGGLLGTDSGSHYCMSKGAVAALTKTLATQMARHQIKVNAVCPGFVNTAISGPGLADPDARDRVIQATPLGRLGEASDVASAVAFLASSDADWITGVLLPVDGGYSVV